jgi:phospholipase C
MHLLLTQGLQVQTLKPVSTQGLQVQILKTGFSKAMAITAAAALTLAPVCPTFAKDRDDFATKTPIKHVVVIFQENVSFDHYFGTYPHAFNLPGETPFHAKEDTPEPNNLKSSGLLEHNPNKVNPFRIPPSIPVTCDEDHNYGDEQAAAHSGLMDLFVEKLSCNEPKLGPVNGPASTMGYYDGNTVTAMWNYAQHFAMSDNSWGTTFGPSTPGALNLIAGNTFPPTLAPKRPNGKNATPAGNIAGGIADPTVKTGAVIGDPRPLMDDCVASNPAFQNVNQISMSGKNVGDLLNAKSITWGWFQGGFAPTGTDGQGRAVCAQHHTGLAGDDAVVNAGDYIPHHEPFMYFASTTNPHHLRPSSPSMIGKTDQANHQYDLTDFFTALNGGNLPAVSYLKAGAYQDGHAGYSDPIDEQIFVVTVINALMQSKEWNETAVIISWDDSDGWYDHQMGPIVRQSNVADDQLLGPGNCGMPKANDVSGGTQNGRCGLGPRLPLLVVSPWAKRNFIDNTITDQSSILAFIEDNWNLGRIGGGSTDATAGRLTNMFDFDDGPKAGRLILDPQTGQKVDRDDE